MIVKYFDACLAMLLLFLLLYLWRAIYPESDWAALAFLPLLAMLFWGYLSFSAAIYRARLHIAIKPESPLAGILTGKIKAVFGAAIFVLISVPLLAWQALTTDFPEVLALMALCLFANLLFIGLQSGAQSHLHRPFATGAAISLGTWIAAIIFIPIIAWMNWNYASYPGEIRGAGFSEAVILGIQELPQRRGWIAEVLAPMYAYEAGKLWVVVQLGASRWATTLFSLDTALIGFIVARASIILTLLIQTLNFDEDTK